MTYIDQIEHYVALYPETASATVPDTCGVVTLPAYPHVEVQIWANEFCQLEDAAGGDIARFRLVG
jgi:hypothetical protein